MVAESAILSAAAPAVVPPVARYAVSAFEFLSGKLKDKMDETADSTIQDAAENKWDEARLKKRVEERLKWTIERLSEKERFDPENLNSYLGEHLTTDAAMCFLAETTSKRRAAKETLIRNAYNCVPNASEPQRRAIEQYIGIVMEMVEKWLVGKDDDTGLKTFIGKNVDELRAELADQLNRIEEKLGYKDSFEEFLDGIAPITAESNRRKSPFHYRNDILQCRGREEQLKMLRGFLETEGALRWTVITGAGGSGKSKLLYRFTQEMEWHPEWRVVWMNMEDIKTANEKFWRNWKLPQKLLVVVDYVGLSAEQLGKWLSALKSSTLEHRPPKVRFVLLERESVGEIKPMWYTSLTAHYEEEDAENARWNPPTGWRMESLTDPILKEILEEYLEHENKTLTERRKEEIVQKLHSIEKTGERARPLLMIFLADALLEKGDLTHWNEEKLLIYLLKRTREHWKNQLSGTTEQKELRLEAAEILVLYATACGGWKLGEKNLPSRFAAAVRTLCTDKATKYKTGELKALFRSLNDSDCGDGLDALEPDLLGEAYVLTWMQDHEYDDYEEIVQQLWLKSFDFAVFLDRCMDDFAAGKWKEAVRSLVTTRPEENNRAALIVEALLLVNLTVKQSTAEEVAETVQELKKLYESHPKTAEIAIEYAKGLLNLTAKQSAAEEVAETVQELKKLYESHPKTAEIAIEYAKGLVNLTAKQSTAEEVAETVQELKTLYESHPEAVEIAAEYAKVLFNLTVKQSAAEEVAETVRELKKLYESHPEAVKIAVAYAMGLVSLTVEQSAAEEVAETVQELKKLYESHPKTAEIAIEYAKGLVNLTAEQSAAEEVAETVQELKKLYESHPKTAEIAAEYAKGLVNLTIEQSAAEEVAETVQELKKLYESHSEAVEIAVAYAKGLINLTVRQSAAEEVAETVQELKKLYELPPEAVEIAVAYAMGLVNLTARQSAAEEAAETVREMKKLYESHPEAAEIAVRYANALFNLTAKQSAAEEAAETVREMKKLYESHPEAAEIAVRYANALFNLTVKQSAAEEAAETVQEMKKLYESHPKTAEIAIEYAKGLVSLTVRQSAAEEAAKTVRELKGVYESHTENAEIGEWYEWLQRFLKKRWPDVDSF